MGVLPGSFDWNADAVEKLKRLWRDGLSCTAIGKDMGVTRNAIIGKVGRLGLPKRSKAVNQANQISGRKVFKRPHVAKPPTKPRVLKLDAAAIARRQSMPTKAVDLAPLPESAPRPWITRHFGECAWPVGGEGADTLSCCARTGGHVYCAGHLAIRSPAPPAKLRRAA